MYVYDINDIYIYTHLYIHADIDTYSQYSPLLPRPSWVFHLNVQLRPSRPELRAPSWRRMWCWETWLFGENLVTYRRSNGNQWNL